MNVRGIKSKKVSIQKILKRVKPNVVTLNETQLLGRAKVELKPFTCWSKNRTERGGGGVCTGVAPHLAHSAVGAGEGQGDDEFLVTRLEAFDPPPPSLTATGSRGGWARR